MTWIFFGAFLLSITAMLIARRVNRAAKHEAWRRDIERRERGKGIDQGRSKWPWVVNE